MERRAGNDLHLIGVDRINGTPLLDPEPDLPRLDAHAATRTGWPDGQADARPWEARFEADVDDGSAR